MNGDARMLDQIDDYLAGRLANDDLDLFEEALLESDELQQKVILAQEFRAGLAEASDQLLEVKESFAQKLNNLVRSTFWAYSSTAAAVVAVVFIAGKPEMPVDDGIVDAIVYVEQVRSGTRPQIQVMAGTNTLLSIDAVEFANKPFTLSISQGETEHALVGPLVANQELAVNYSVPTLSPGQYELVLSNSATKTTYDLLVHAAEPL